MDEPESIRILLKELLHSQTLGVLSTHEGGQPYASLVAYAVTEDLRGLVFTTATATRKFANLSADNRVAMLVNNAVNAVEDFHRAAAVTALGRVQVLAPGAASNDLKLFVAKHPYLKEFAESPTTALLRIAVDRYIIVKQFQKVIEIDVSAPLPAFP